MRCLFPRFSDQNPLLSGGKEGPGSRLVHLHQNVVQIGPLTGLYTTLLIRWIPVFVKHVLHSLCKFLLALSPGQLSENRPKQKHHPYNYVVWESTVIIRDETC